MLDWFVETLAFAFGESCGRAIDTVIIVRGVVFIDMATDEAATKLIRVTQRGQATIPKEWRDRLGIEAPGEVVMIAVDDSIVVKPPRSLDELAGRHADALADGEATEKLRQWHTEEAERERADERLHGLDS